jgi:hypothetical protein
VNLFLCLQWRHVRACWFFLLSGVAVQRVPGPPLSWCFQITQNYTSHWVGLLWTRNRPIAMTSSWQHTRDRHPVPRRDSTNNRRNRAATEPRFRQLGHWDMFIYKVQIFLTGVLGGGRWFVWRLFGFLLSTHEIKYRMGPRADPKTLKIRKIFWHVPGIKPQFFSSPARNIGTIWNTPLEPSNIWHTLNVNMYVKWMWVRN